MNELFDGGREAFLTGQIDWTKDRIRAALCTHDTVKPDVKRHVWLSEISECVVSKSRPLAGKKGTSGVASAENASFIDVPSKRIQSMVIYREGESADSSRLIAYVDTVAGGTFPFTPNGDDVQISWDRGPNKIFRL